MESKVLLYDSNDVKIGETFTRRARQLVKQQRASWINENQDAIRFAPDFPVSEWEVERYTNLLIELDCNHAKLY